MQARSDESTSRERKPKSVVTSRRSIEEISVFLVCLCRFQRTNKQHMAAATHRAVYETRVEAEIKSRLKLSHIAQLCTQITLSSRHTAGFAMSTIASSRNPESIRTVTIRARKRVPPTRCAAIDPNVSSCSAEFRKRESSSNGSSTTRGSRDMGIPRGFCDSRISLGPGERRPARIHRRHVDAVLTSVVPCAETKTKRFLSCNKFC